MDFKNDTKNQHFLSQVEQRLNSINPNAREENQKIFSFNILDRESYLLKLESDKGTKISKSLAINDLFSFDVINKSPYRFNFEDIFNQYERNIKINTMNLLNKLPDVQSNIKPEVLNLFISKFLNFVRNPFSIKKVLNSFPELASFKPTSVVDLNYYEKIITGRKPQQLFLCNQLNISEKDYQDWLTIIFMLLTRHEENKPNLIELVIKELFENPDSYIMVLIYCYEKHTCLLSDRGYSIPVPETDHMAFDFNLNSNTFIRYFFGDINKLAPSGYNKVHVDDFKSSPKSITVRYFENELKILEQYNRNVVYQSYKTVFNSSRKCYGL